MQEVKREIVKKAVQGAKKGMPPISTRTGAQSSSATLGVYRTGPWSDSLGTTNVKVPKAPEKASGFGQGGPGFGTIGQFSKKKALSNGKGGTSDNANAATSNASVASSSSYSDPTLQLDPMSDYYYNPSLVNRVGSGNYLNPGIQNAVTQGQQSKGIQAPIQAQEQKQPPSNYPQAAATQPPGTPSRVGTNKAFTSRAPVTLAMRKFPGSAVNMPSVSAQGSKYNRMPNITRVGQSPRSIISRESSFRNRKPKTLTNKSYSK